MFQEKGFVHLVVPFIVVVLIGVGMVLFLQDKAKPLKKVFPSPSAVVSNSTSGEIPQPSFLTQVISSEDGKYDFLLKSKDEEVGRCTFEIYRHSERIVGRQPAGLESIACGYDYFAQRLTSSQFKGFRGDYLVLEPRKGEVSLFNMEDGDSRSLSYEVKDRELVTFSRDLKYLLFSNEYKRNDIYTVEDLKGKVIFDLSSIDQSQFAIYKTYYDSTHNGILIILRTNTSDSSRIRVMFYSLKTLSLRTLLTTDPKAVAGRGCGGSTYFSEGNKLFIEDSCLIIDQKYLNKFGQIELSL